MNKRRTFIYSRFIWPVSIGNTCSEPFSQCLHSSSATLIARSSQFHTLLAHVCMASMQFWRVWHNKSFMPTTTTAISMITDNWSVGVLVTVSSCVVRGAGKRAEAMYKPSVDIPTGSTLAEVKQSLVGNGLFCLIVVAKKLTRKQPFLL